MTAAERIDAILDYCEISASQLSREIGLDRPQALYDIQKGKTKNISTDMADRIHKARPCFKKVWLKTGEGDMLDMAAPEVQKHEVKKAKPSEFVSIMNALSESIRNKDKQIDRLLTMNERLGEEVNSLNHRIEVLSDFIERMNKDANVPFEKDIV